MSVKNTADAINAFLATPEPEVLCLTGPWGVGKTYAWAHFLKLANKIALEEYAYVSLFGLNSIQDVRSSIFENTQPTRPAAISPEAPQWKQKLECFGREIVQYREILGGVVGGATAVAERLMF